MMSQQAISMAATAHMWICAPSEQTSRISRCDDQSRRLKRVHPDDERLQFVDGRFDGLGKVVQRALADSVNPFIRGDLGEQPVLPRIACDVSVDTR